MDATGTLVQSGGNDNLFRTEALQAQQNALLGEIHIDTSPKRWVRCADLACHMFLCNFRFCAWRAIYG